MILRPASEIYHDAKSDRKLYVCHNYPACNTYVAAHPNTDKPMGVPANGNLRNLRIQAHRKFDLIWKNAIGCEAICRAALKYQPDMGAFAPFACRYIYNAIVDHCRAMNYRLERSVEISEDENASLLDMLTCTSVDFDETVTDATAMSALAACKEKYNGVARKGVEAIEMKLKGYEATEIAKHYDTSVNNVNAWISRARSKLRNEPALLEILY